MDYPCFCSALHEQCTAPAPCAPVRIALPPIEPTSNIDGHKETENYSLRHLLLAIEQGCATCTMIYRGLQVADIKDSWSTADWAGKPDEDQLDIQYVRIANGRQGDSLSFQTHGYVIVRVLVEGWRHFIYTREGSANAPRHCQALSITKTPSALCTGPGEKFEILREWMSKCNTNHKCWTGGTGQLPTRVLNVSSDTIRVEYTNARPGLYTTLSHRWGDSKILCLTSKTRSRLEAGFPLSDLPVTFQQAIRITRELDERIEYIWIDSLCIIQDSEDDWKRESVKMREVYGGSYLNIAASHAPDEMEGCFGSPHTVVGHETIPRDHPVPGERGVYVRELARWAHHDFGSKYRPNASSAPLLRRGWVLQERLLSPRVVYFSKSELLWECNELADCQCSAITVMSPFKSFWKNSILGLPPLYDVQEPLVYAWMRVILKYSEMDLSYESDRLIALSGIAQEVLATGRAGRYLAGLWSEKLEHQICWSVVGGYRSPQEYLAPSWSCLSVMGGIFFSNRADITSRGSEIFARIIDVNCVSKDPKEETGPVMAGCLTVDGQAVSLKATMIEEAGELPARYTLQHGSHTLPLITFAPDVIDFRGTVGSVIDVTLLLWGKMFRYDQGSFLVLRKTQDNATARWTRFGLIQFMGGARACEAKPLLELCQRQDPSVYSII